jgi:hypothetical protein
MTEYFIIGLGAIMAILAIFKEHFPNKKKWYNFTIIFIIISIAGIGMYSRYHNDTIKNEMIKTEKIRCHKALSVICSEIYRTISDYNKNKKNNFKEAEKKANTLFKIDGEQLERIRNDYKEYIDSSTLKAIDDALMTLLDMPEQIIQSRNKCDFLYNDICKIDSSFKKEKSLWESINH